MTRSPAPRRSGASLWLGLAALAVVVLVLAPQAIATGIGQVMAEALVAALVAVAAIFGPLAGGG